MTPQSRRNTFFCLLQVQAIIIDKCQTHITQVAMTNNSIVYKKKNNVPSVLFRTSSSNTKIIFKMCIIFQITHIYI